GALPGGRVLPLPGPAALQSTRCGLGTRWPPGLRNLPLWARALRPAAPAALPAQAGRAACGVSFARGARLRRARARRRPSDGAPVGAAAGMSPRAPGRNAIVFVAITVLLDTMGFGLIIPVLPSLLVQITGASVSQAAIYGGWLAFMYAAM